MKKIIFISLVLLGVTSLSAFSLSDVTTAVSSMQTTQKAAPTTTQKSGDLTSMLTSQLGVTDKQASGGVGSILSYAQSALPKNKYTTLASAIPNASSLLKMAPQVSKQESGLGAMAGSLMGSGSSTSNLAGLASQFSSLGLNSSMISQFVPIIANYLKSSNSGSAASILTGLF